MQAKDLMSTDLVIVPPETPVTALADLLASRGISAVPVVETSGKPLGIVTESDLIRRLAEVPRGPLTRFFDLFRSTPQALRFAKARGKTARDLMTRDLVTVSEDATEGHIAQLMEKHAIRRVLVVRDGALVGLVSRADLLRAILQPQAAAPALGDDRAILRAVLAAMREQRWTDTFWVYPGVADGVVTLHGFARSGAVREGLHVLLQEVPGVKSVVDKLDDMPLVARMVR